MNEIKKKELIDDFKSCLKDGVVSENMQDAICEWWLARIELELEEMQDLADYNAYKNK